MVAQAEYDALVAENQELREALARAGQTDARDAFIARVSHELRSPLHVILGACEVLREELAKAPANGTVATIEQAGRTLLRLIDDVLDLSKMRAGLFTLSPTTFRLLAPFEEVERALTPMALRKGLDLRFVASNDVPELVRGDAGRLRQVVTNLVTNAIKFTEAGGVVVRVRGGADGAVEISVADTGAGIAEEDAATLFDPFRQGASGKKTSGGTGLGLTICRQLVDQMGGSIRYVSTLGAGTTFVVVLHLEVASAEGASTPSLPAADLPQANADREHRDPVLVVEDTDVSRIWACRVLERSGFRVMSAANGAEALDLLARHPFSAVVMDWHMPGMDGLEVTRAIRAGDGPAARVPILALTASASEADRATCLEAGMNEALTKPISGAGLVARVAHWAEGVQPTENAALRGLPPDVVRELVELFARDTKKCLTALRRALTRDDAVEAGRRLHALKGMSGNLGMNRVHQMARQLEAQLRSDAGPSKVRAQLPDLEKACAEACVA